MASDTYSFWTVACSKCDYTRAGSDRVSAESTFARIAAQHSSRVLRPAANISQRAANQAVDEERARISRSERTWPRCEACGLEQVVRAKGVDGGRLCNSSIRVVLECMSL